MSTLKQSLETIHKWVEEYMPKHPAAMNPGLSQQIIDAKVAEFSFQLPEEICELYQWRNGGKKPFIPHPEGWDLASFLPLEEALSAVQSLGDFIILPIFSLEGGIYFTLCTEEKAKIAPIYCSDSLDASSIERPRYLSLGSMMQHLVEELDSRRGDED
jgi:hypothetical protein